jgi:uncharacterized membrane protein (UPF0136 family)
MPQPALISFVVVSAVLIVGGRLNHRTRWGTRVAIAGFAVLALVALLRLLS